MVMLASFRAKISKYGHRVLETIESTIKEYYKTDKNSRGSNDSTDTIKRMMTLPRAWISPEEGL